MSTWPVGAGKITRHYESPNKIAGNVASHVAESAAGNVVGNGADHGAHHVAGNAAGHVVGHVVSHGAGRMADDVAGATADSVAELKLPGGAIQLTPIYVRHVRRRGGSRRVVSLSLDAVIACTFDTRKPLGTWTIASLLAAGIILAPGPWLLFVPGVLAYIVWRGRTLVIATPAQSIKVRIATVAAFEVEAFVNTLEKTRARALHSSIHGKSLP